MEEICIRIPLLAEDILKEVDNKSLANYRMISREICAFLDNGRILWKQMILKNIQGKHFVTKIKHEISIEKLIIIKYSLRWYILAKDPTCSPGTTPGVQPTGVQPAGWL